MDAAYYVEEDNIPVIRKEYIIRRTKQEVGIKLPPCHVHKPISVNWSNKYEQNLSKEINQCYKSRILYKDFDFESYLQKNKDLVKNNLKTKDQAWWHWTLYGWHENRKI